MRVPFKRILGRVRSSVAHGLNERWLADLRAAGLQLGEDTYFPDSTYVDPEYAHLIRIGNGCGFGAQVMLLAHDDGPEPLLGAVRVGTVTINDSSHIGARTIVFPGVEIGPFTVVSACSVVRSDLPPNTFCAGNPARPFASLEQYLDAHRKRLAASPQFAYDLYDIRSLTPERRAELVAAAAAGDAYIVGGRTAELEGRGGTPRTESRNRMPPRPLGRESDSDPHR